MLLHSRKELIMEHGLMERIQQAVAKHLGEAEALSRELGEHPELPYQEFESSRKIAKVLKDAGFEVTYPYAGYETAFSAFLDNGDGPSVAILTEYDALPEIGHGCGHNLHGALSVLAGLTLMEMREDFKGKLYVIGTPAEEENGAKIGMADQGIFDEMSLAVMMHSYGGGASFPNMDVLSLRCYVVEFFGQTAHAVSCPWKGKSALAAGRKFLDLIDARRECFTPDIHVNAVILDGGKAPNIIPDYTKIRLEFRTDSAARLNQVDEMIKKCADAAAMALDCTVKLEFGLSDFADMVRNQTLEDEITELFHQVGQRVKAVEPASGSSDMGNVSYRCPAIQPLLSITDDSLALHTVEFRDATMEPQAVSAMGQGAAAMTALALRTFTDEAFRQKTADSFQEALASKLAL